MELAVNQFTKGLQVDTNPMVQGDDTLSDALNATFVTMNGNEVILLNDMGNRRVDHAFLPAGYEPVGIKEYGGVIYVASYNPITNRSQIGSFPSPERILSSLDNPNLGIESYTFSRFFEEPNIETIGGKEIDGKKIGGISFLKNDEFMDLLTADTSLHAGDKFSIYSNYIWNYILKQENKEYINQKYISHFNNWDGQKLISPKNKLFTLSVGVMNSLNEFVDITESLERFDETNKIIKVENDALKLDDGYFIAPYKPATTNIERNLLAVNTYSYKLVGPLQLKTTLNHILNFDFIMDWQKSTSEEESSSEEESPSEESTLEEENISEGGSASEESSSGEEGSTLGEESTSEEESISEESTPKNLYVLIIRGIATYNCPDEGPTTNNLTEARTETETGEGTTTPLERKEYAKRARFDILLNTQRTIAEAFESFDIYIKKGEEWIKLDNTSENVSEDTSENTSNNTSDNISEDTSDNTSNNTSENTFESTSDILDSITTYDINTDLYTSTITKKYSFTIDDTDNKILPYYICVKALAKPYKEIEKEGEEEKEIEYNDIYLKNLSYQGEVDLTKIGSNIVELKEYRYLYEPALDPNNKGLATMTFFTEAYPDHFTEFTDFKILLELWVTKEGRSSWESVDPNLYEAGTVLSERITFSFPTPLARTLYRVVFSYNKKSTVEESLAESHTIYRYLLTTELFNDCYYGSSGDYVEDYGLFMGEISGEQAPYTITYDGQTILTGISEDLKKIRDNYLEVKLKLDGNIINKTATPTLNTEGTFIIPNTENSSSDISYKTTYSTTVDLIYNYEVVIDDLNNYPEYIKLNSNTKIDSINSPRIDYAIDFVDQRIEEKGVDYTNVLVAEIKSISNSSSGSGSESSTSTTNLAEDPTSTTNNDTNNGNLTSTTNDEPSTSTTGSNEVSIQQEYLGEKEAINVNDFEVTQNIRYYDIFKAKTTPSTEKTFGTLYVDLNNVDIMKERLFRSYCSGFLVGANGDHRLFYTYPLIPGFVKTWVNYSRDLFSLGYNNLSFIDLEDNKYRMGTALSTLVNQNIDNNFIYMFTEVEESDDNAERDDNVHFPANGLYYVLKTDDAKDDVVDSGWLVWRWADGLEVFTNPGVVRYYLDYYTMVFWKTNNDNNLYQLGTKPWKYRDQYKLKIEGTIDQYRYDVYNPDDPVVHLNRRWKRAVGLHYDPFDPDAYVPNYNGRSNAVNGEFYQNILDFIGITQERSYEITNALPVILPVKISNWDALDLVQTGSFIAEFEIKVENNIEGQNIIIQTGNKRIIIEFFDRLIQLDPPKNGSTIGAGWAGKILSQSVSDNITTYTVCNLSYLYAYDTYSYVVPISNYFPEGNLLFPDNTNYCYNHTYKLIGNVFPTTVNVIAELEENNSGESNLLKLGLKDENLEELGIQISLDTKSVEIILNTDSTFEESCNSILYDDLLNDMYLETGEKVPRPGEYNNIYVSKNKGKLILVNNPPFIYSMENNSINFKNKGTTDLKSNEYLLKSVAENENGDGPSFYTKGTRIKLDLIKVITKEVLEYHADAGE